MTCGVADSNNNLMIFPYKKGRGYVDSDIEMNNKIVSSVIGEQVELCRGNIYTTNCYLRNFGYLFFTEYQYESAKTFDWSNKIYMVSVDTLEYVLTPFNWVCYTNECGATFVQKTMNRDTENMYMWFEDCIKYSCVGFYNYTYLDLNNLIKKQIWSEKMEVEYSNCNVAFFSLDYNSDSHQKILFDQLFKYLKENPV